MTVSTENAKTLKIHKIQKLRFLGTNSNKRAAARHPAPKLPRAIRAGANAWRENSGAYATIGIGGLYNYR